MQISEKDRLAWVDLEFRTMKRNKKADRILWWILVVATALVFLSAIASVIMFLVQKDASSLETTVNQLLMSFLALLCFFIPVFFQKKLKIYIPSFFLIIIYLFIYTHFILGEIYRIYDSSIVFDKILHTTAGIVIALIGISVVYSLANMKSEKVRLSPFFVVLFAFCFSLTIEYLWELFEYAIDRLTDMNMQRWKDGVIAYDPEGYPEGSVVSSVAFGSGLKDSMGDMFVNVLGALGVCVISFFILVKKPQWFEGRIIISEKKLRRIAEEWVEAYIAAESPLPDFSALLGEEDKKRRVRRVKRRKSDGDFEKPQKEEKFDKND